MQTLAIDTSQEDGYVALFKGPELIGHSKIKAKMQTSSLLEIIDHLLKNHDISLELIDIFAVCTGPGSFTGTRIGVITAKTFAYARSKKVVGYTSFIGRTPQVAFLSKRKIALLEGDQITYQTLEDPSIYDERELDLCAIGIHIEKQGALGRKEVTVSYPDAL